MWAGSVAVVSSTTVAANALRILLLPGTGTLMEILTSRAKTRIRTLWPMAALRRET